MNREDKRKTFEKGYYKAHACNDAFTCKVCGRVCTPQNAGSAGSAPIALIAGTGSTWRKSRSFCVSCRKDKETEAK